MSETFRPYVVRQGDYMARLAERYGFDPDEVWSHDQNRELREQRSSPDVLAPGDILYLPAPELVRQALSPNTTNRYRAQIASTTVRVHVELDGEPLANASCTVHLAEPLEAQTDGQGLLTFSCPMHHERVRVVFAEPQHEMTILVGHLDPHQTRTGVASRLQNLGYLEPDHGLDEEHRRSELAHALAEFQEAQGLTVTGALDDATRGALEEAHGS